VVLSAAGTVGAATYVARRLLTPDLTKPEDIEILGIQGDSVTLPLNSETGQPGRYGLWFNGGRGHARLGEVLDTDLDSGRVRRMLEGVDFGDLGVGPARWNQYYFAGTPQQALGLPSREVEIESEIGRLAAWEVLADPQTAAVPGVSGVSGLSAVPGVSADAEGLAVPGVSADAEGGGTGSSSGRWAILVHGRGAERGECLRAVPVLHELGFTALIPLYRNDLGAPSSPDGRYSLGLSEWRDCEAALAYAVDAGASEIVLVGWSMGGAIILQTLDRSPLQDRVTAVVLDAPVIDWGDVLRHHGALHKIPGAIGSLSRTLIGHPWARRLVGVHEPIDVALTNWENRAGELKHRTLLIHSLDDEFVPVGPSVALAAKRPDLVRFEPWQTALHTKEWNTDPERWDAAVREFLTP